MRRMLVTIVCVGAGFWLGANRLVPLWGLCALAVLGGSLWGLVKWREAKGHDHDQD